jgi:hypothetical protein
MNIPKFKQMREGESPKPCDALTGFVSGICEQSLASAPDFSGSKNKFWGYALDDFGACPKCEPWRWNQKSGILKKIMPLVLC